MFISLMNCESVKLTLFTTLDLNYLSNYRLVFNCTFFPFAPAFKTKLSLGATTGLFDLLMVIGDEVSTLSV
jgi:hypothetical protein